MDIGEVAQLSGLPASAIRYYEAKGLIASVSRKGLRRQFSDLVVQRLALIQLGRQAGFSLDELKQMFDDNEGAIDRQLLRDKADELDEQIRQLVRMRDGLRHAADCPAPSHFECPKFLRILQLVGKRPLPSA
ncbi:helix-turn-helix domain-containing protein [Bacterioplanoides sp.]|uniref:helix-turn-helix domain-containing protein n=1 Tax=Bacterioplanoides sp. TaxID=2066072 RepID=UPI003B5C2C95